MAVRLRKITKKASAAAKKAPARKPDDKIVTPSPLSRLALLLLCCFAGFLGAHRYYARRYLSSILMFFTIGFLFLGVLYDAVRIIRGSFVDRAGRPVTRWRTPNDQLALATGMISIVVPLKMLPIIAHLIITAILVQAEYFGLYRPEPRPALPVLQAPLLPPTTDSQK